MTLPARPQDAKVIRLLRRLMRTQALAWKATRNEFCLKQAVAARNGSLTMDSSRS